MKLWKLVRKLNLNTHIRVYKGGLKYGGLVCDLPCFILFSSPKEKVSDLSIDENGVLEIILSQEV